MCFTATQLLGRHLLVFLVNQLVIRQPVLAPTVFFSTQAYTKLELVILSSRKHFFKLHVEWITAYLHSQLVMLQHTAWSDMLQLELLIRVCDWGDADATHSDRGYWRPVVKSDLRGVHLYWVWIARCDLNRYLGLFKISMKLFSKADCVKIWKISMYQDHMFFWKDKNTPVQIFHCRLFPKLFIF